MQLKLQTLCEARHDILETLACSAIQVCQFWIQHLTRMVGLFSPYKLGGDSWQKLMSSSMRSLAALHDLRCEFAFLHLERVLSVHLVRLDCKSRGLDLWLLLTQTAIGTIGKLKARPASQDAVANRTALL